MYLYHCMWVAISCFVMLCCILYTVNCIVSVHCIYPRGDNPESGHAHIHLARLRPPDAAIATP